MLYLSDLKYTKENIYIIEHKYNNVYIPYKNKPYLYSK
jgi:hypothetical protein